MHLIVKMHNVNVIFAIERCDKCQAVLSFKIRSAFVLCQNFEMYFISTVSFLHLTLVLKFTFREIHAARKHLTRIQGFSFAVFNIL